MARSHGVIKVEVWEPRSDFRQLGIDGQWAFAMLISQPQINNLGVLPYVPEKWARLAADLDSERLQRALAALEHDRYTITDTATGELLVRTFIRHDAVWKQPRLVTNARRLYRELESKAIADHLADRHPWLVDEGWTPVKIQKHESSPKRRETPLDTPSETPLDTPLADAGENGSEKPLSEGVSPPRAHAQDGLGLPQPLPHLASKAVAETRARATTDKPAAAFELDTLNPTIDQPDFAPNLADPIIRLVLELSDRDAGTEHTIRANFGQLPEAAFHYTREEVQRCRGTTDSDAGLAFRVLERITDTGLIGDEPAAANGNTKPPATAIPCPHCGLELIGPRTLAEHLHHIHDGPIPDHWQPDPAGDQEPGP